MNYKCSLLVFTLFYAVTHADDIYQYQDKNGTTVFSNKPVKNAQKVTLPPLTIYAAPMTQNDFNAQSYTNEQSLSRYPKIAPSHLGSREQGRRQILAEELAHEKNGLDDAQQALATSQQTKLASEKNNPQQYQARLQALQDTITEHQKNIAILSQQLDNVN